MPMHAIATGESAGNGVAAGALEADMVGMCHCLDVLGAGCGIRRTLEVRVAQEEEWTLNGSAVVRLGRGQGIGCRGSGAKKKRREGRR